MTQRMHALQHLLYQPANACRNLESASLYLSLPNKRVSEALARAHTSACVKLLLWADNFQDIAFARFGHNAVVDLCSPQALNRLWAMCHQGATAPLYTIGAPFSRQWAP